MFPRISGTDFLLRGQALYCFLESYHGVHRGSVPSGQSQVNHQLIHGVGVGAIYDHKRSMG